MLQPHGADMLACSFRERGARIDAAQATARLRRWYCPHQLVLRKAEDVQPGECASAQPRRWDGGGEVVVSLHLH